MRQNRYLQLSFPILLLSHKEHRQAGNQRHAEDNDIYAAFSFGLTVVEKPHLAVVLPFARPFPTAKHPRQPESKQNCNKQICEFRVSLRPLETFARLPADSLPYLSNSVHVDEI